MFYHSAVHLKLKLSQASFFITVLSSFICKLVIKDNIYCIGLFQESYELMYVRVQNQHSECCGWLDMSIYCCYCNYYHYHVLSSSLLPFKTNNDPQRQQFYSGPLPEGLQREPGTHSILFLSPPVEECICLFLCAKALTRGPHPTALFPFRCPVVLKHCLVLFTCRTLLPEMNSRRQDVPNVVSRRALSVS